MVRNISVVILIFILSLSLLLSSCKPSTGPSGSEYYWEIALGDSIEGESVTETSDGGYVITGQKFIDGTYHVYLAEVNEYGRKLWDNTYKEGYGLTVIPAFDGGYIVGGWSGVYIYIMKTNSSGIKLWEKTLDEGACVCLCYNNDGGYMICGSRDFGVVESYVYLSKIDGSGNVIWEKTYGGSQRDIGNHVQSTSDGGYILMGSTFSYGTAYTADLYLIKVDSAGNQEWYRTFGGAGDDGGSCVRVADDGGYIISGFTYSFGDEHGYIIKTDTAGNEVWSEKYDIDYARAVRTTEDGGYIFAGGKDYDVHLIKVNSDGLEIWNRVYGGEYGEEVKDLEITSEGGYVFVGNTYSFGPPGFNAYIVKTDKDGYIDRD